MPAKMSRKCTIQAQRSEQALDGGDYFNHLHQSPRSYFNMTPNAWKMLLCSPDVPRPISQVARYRPNIIGHPGINPNLSTKRSLQNHAHQSRETTSARPQLPQKSRYAVCCNVLHPTSQIAECRPNIIGLNPGISKASCQKRSTDQNKHTGKTSSRNRTGN